jgi:urease accessory protein
VCATLIACGLAALDNVQLQDLRDDVATASRGAPAGVTQFKQLVVVRHLGGSSETARAVLLGAWRRLRPLMFAREVHVPRLWNT